MDTRKAGTGERVMSSHGVDRAKMRRAGDKRTNEQLVRHMERVALRAAQRVFAASMAQDGGGNQHRGKRNGTSGRGRTTNDSDGGSLFQ